jgi:hypothetical protein
VVIFFISPGKRHNLESKHWRELIREKLKKSLIYLMFIGTVKKKTLFFVKTP